LSYVPQILSEHKAACDSSTNSYEHAVKCGEHLNNAKDAVKKKGWTAYCEKHLAHIPQTTRSLYMRLAEPDNQKVINEKITELAKLGEQGKLSIRSAAKLIGPTRGGSTKSEAEKAADKATRVKVTVKAYLTEMDADDLAELIKSIYDADYIDTLIECFTPKDDGENTPQTVRRLQPSEAAPN
jgi:hypothetical protein